MPRPAFSFQILPSFSDRLDSSHDPPCLLRLLADELASISIANLGPLGQKTFQRAAFNLICAAFVAEPAGSRQGRARTEMHPLKVATHLVEQACNPLQTQDPHFGVGPELPRRSLGRRQCRLAPVSSLQLIPENLAQEIKKALKRPTVPVSTTPQPCRVSKARPVLNPKS